MHAPCQLCPYTPSLPAEDVEPVRRLVGVHGPFQLGFSGIDTDGGDRLLTPEGLDCIHRAKLFLTRHPVTAPTSAHQLKVTMESLPGWHWAGIGAMIAAAHLLGYNIQRRYGPRRCFDGDAIISPHGVVVADRRGQA